MIGSAPGSAGDGNMEEEAEGSVLRWRSSVKEKTFIVRIKIILF